jgi:ribosomal protein S19E (S16A)
LREEQDCMVERPIGAKLRRALEDKGWSYTRLIAEMRRIAAREAVGVRRR